MDQIPSLLQSAPSCPTCADAEHLYLIYWLATSRATVFLHMTGDQLVVAGDEWLIKLQEAQREAYVERQQQV